MLCMCDFYNYCYLIFYWIKIWVGIKYFYIGYWWFNRFIEWMGCYGNYDFKFFKDFWKGVRIFFRGRGVRIF